MVAMKKLSIIVLFGILVLTLPAHAKIYKWVDENGKVHYTNDPSQVPQTEDAKVKTFGDIKLLYPPQKEEPQEETSETQIVPLYDEEGVLKPGLSKAPENSRKKKEQTLAEHRESYRNLLDQARKSREEQLKKIAELQEMEEKPKYGSRDESLKKRIEGLKKSLKKSEKEIRKYANKIKSTSLTD